MSITPQFRWDVATVLIGPAILSMTVIPLYVLTIDVSPWVWLMFAVFMLWNGVSIMAGYQGFAISYARSKADCVSNDANGGSSLPSSCEKPERGFRGMHDSTRTLFIKQLLHNSRTPL